MLGSTSYKLKINYSNIKTSPILTSVLPLTVIAKARNIGHIYYADLDIQSKYKIAYLIFKKIGVIYPNINNINVIDYSELPFSRKTGTEAVSNVTQEDLIEYFIKYNIHVKNLLITVYNKEWVTAVDIPSIFMDVKSDDILVLETDIDKMIMNTYRKFLSTPQGSIPFLPWFGTRIKHYLHELSVYQVSEMLQGEIDGVTNALKIYFTEKNILDYEFSAQVSIEENTQYYQIEYKILIKINDKHYTIAIK